MFHGSAVAFDRVVPPLSIDVPDAVGGRVISVIDLPDASPIGVGHIGADRNRPMQPDPFDCLAEKGLRGLGISPRR